MSLRPNTELVALAWLADVEGLNAGMVATQLPADNTSWAASGFVTVVVAGGAPGLYTPVRSPVISVDTWAVSPSSNKPPWFKANQLMELIVAAGYRGEAQRWVLPKPGYLRARVTGAYVLGEPRRIYEDEAAYARYSANLQLHWVAES